MAEQGGNAMKAKMLVSVIASTMVLLVLSASVQGASQDTDARLAAFQKRLDQQGFDVTTGRARAFSPLEDWCNDLVDDAQCVNSGLYLILEVPESATPMAKNLTRFRIRHDEAIVLIGQTPPP